MSLCTPTGRLVSATPFKDIKPDLEAAAVGEVLSLYHKGWCLAGFPHTEEQMEQLEESGSLPPTRVICLDFARKSDDPEESGPL